MLREFHKLKCLISTVKTNSFIPSTLTAFALQIKNFLKIKLERPKLFLPNNNTSIGVRSLTYTISNNSKSKRLVLSTRPNSMMKIWSCSKHFRAKSKYKKKLRKITILVSIAIKRPTKNLHLKLIRPFPTFLLSTNYNRLENYMER